MMTWIKSNLFFLIVTVAVFASLLFVISCKTFDPVIIEGQPDECNDFYSILGYYSAMGNSDSAFVGTVYTECKTARAQRRLIQREDQCKKLIFGERPLDRDQYKLYAQYLECVKAQ